MKTLRKYLALTAAIIAISIVSVNAQTYSASSKSAKTIEQQINKKLRGLTNYGVFDYITYQVNGGDVILNGKVNSLGTRKSAEREVKRIAGVNRVINNIQDLPPSSFDDQIRRRMLRTFADAGLGQYLWEVNPDVRIIVEHGRVTLEGYVSSRGDYNRMNTYASSISGVFSVQNNLVIGNALKA